MVEIAVARLGLDSSTNSYVVILKERGGNRLLPIWIGQAEAESIVVHINGARRERPLTHDLCKSLITGLGGTLRRVQITKVQKNTYYAELHLTTAEGEVRIDARPSDSIAIALRLDAPIFCPETLLTAVESDDDESEDTESAADEAVAKSQSQAAPAEEDDDEAADLKERLERLRPEDFGKFNL
jgi:bifunctional DNase/RNase